MPEIEFTIDPATGKLEAHVQGVAGPACDDVARLLKALAGAPALEHKTGEYYLRTQVRPQVRPGGGPPRAQG